MAETLTPLDASFLLLERGWAPMHFAGLSIIDSAGRPHGPIGEAELREAVSRRLRRLPRLWQRPVFPWHGLRHAVWEDASVDLEWHVRRHVIPAGDPGGLAALAGLLHAAPLDHTRPLWELHLVDGLPDGRQATLMKIHHSVADGIGGLDVADALFDGRRGGFEPAPRAGAREVPLWLAVLQLVEGVARFAAGGLTPDLPLFTRAVGPRREFAFATLSAADLRAAKRRLGGTVDDVLLEVVAEGLRRHLAPSAASLPAGVRVMVPISTRGLLGGGAGNHVTAMFFDLPPAQSAEAFVERVAAVKGLLRQEHVGPALAALVEVSGRLPAPLQGLAVRLATGWPAFNLVVSDIPGPAEPYRLLGARVEAMYPLMPLAPSAGVSIAALNVGGTVGVGVTADPAQLADPGALAGEIEAAGRELGRPRVRRRPAPAPAAASTTRRAARRGARARRGAAASASASAPRPPR